MKNRFDLRKTRLQKQGYRVALLEALLVVILVLSALTFALAHTALATNASFANAHDGCGPCLVAQSPLARVLPLAGRPERNS